MTIHTIVIQMNPNIAQNPHRDVLQLQIIQSISCYNSIISQIYYFYSIYCWSPSCPINQTFTEKYELSHVLYIPKVPD